MVRILVFTAECGRFGLIKMLESGDARQRSACFVPAGARERSGLRVIVSGFVIIAREEREIQSAVEINKGREREKAEIRIPHAAPPQCLSLLKNDRQPHTHTHEYTQAETSNERRKNVIAGKRRKSFFLL